nr:autotransporter domain-containing protein [Bradyrhizobium sp. dw_411]
MTGQAGGNGGNGGNSTNGRFGGGGGGGGAGGYGAVVTGNGASSNGLGFSVIGGAGGYGGNGGSRGGNGGNGGDGGMGVQFRGAAGTTFTNGGTVGGGIGGAGGGAGYSGMGGNGGAGGMGVQFNAAATFTNNNAVTGGNGGNGGLDSGAGAPGGVGGVGGAGVSMLGGGTLNNFGTIIAGNGGTAPAATNGNNAGNGGVGVAGSSLAITNSGTIQGGNGGLFTNAANPGIAGIGGVAISGSDLTIVNSGTIKGGVSGDVAPVQASAINFTGGTNVLEMRAGSAITGNVIAFSAADTFRLGGTGNASFDASLIGTQYQGFGAFEKTGSSNWTLTGTATQVNAWSVNAGTLSVNGNLSVSTITVNAGATLGGNGTVGNTTINGGTLAPGNSIGTLTVQGNLLLTAASRYIVEVSPSGSDRTNVFGTATLGGATVTALFGVGSYVSKQYTIVNATDGVVGRFSSLVNTNAPANFTSALSYDAKNAYLNLTLNFGIPSGIVGNQQAVGNALTNFFNTTGGIPMVFAALTPAGLSQAAGETATGSQQSTFSAMNMFMGSMLDPFNRGGPAPASGGGVNGYAPEGDASAYASDGRKRSGAERDAYAMFAKGPVAPFEQRWSVWASGFGGSQTTDGNATTGASTSTSSIYGTAVGADYRISPFTVAGFALAGGGTNFNVANGGSGHSDLFQAGAFVRHEIGQAYISAALAYGWQDVTTNRIVTVAGLDQLRAQFNANAFSGRLEGGYRFVAPWVAGIGITPYAAGQFTTIDLPAYAEQAVIGTNNFALAYGAKSVTDPRSELGIRTDKSFAVADGVLTLRGRFAWAHDYTADRSVGATFQALPGASFVVNGAAQASDTALVTAALEKKWLTGWSAAATFEGEFSDVTRSYAGKGVVRYAW